ncbi:four helix bundle protein [Paracerasibacillus soli]|uniref:Four helix bundle protein n=1 Tax=Paracerasibacillus soli TaxID=480284 RepID=A0ABU5CNL4_9BACI|nr:four helix bundle protein [Virgibacillus soli]MDY0407399.1 four helix bundle protein [Virgibacillus soli]
MNETVEQIQDWYRNERELSNYSIIDVEDKLKYLAEKGLIWILKDMKDINELEKIVIDSFLNKYRANQVYDNLNDFRNLQPSNKASTKKPPLLSPKPTSQQKTMKKTLKIRDVKKFDGYLKAKELEEKIIEICKTFPSYDGNIIDQIGRSAESIKKRIAMGEQIYIGEKFYQYSIAIGSAKETSSWLQISLGQGYISQEQYDELDNQVTQIVAILTKTLVNIKDKEGKGMDLPSPYTPKVKGFDAYEQALLLVEKVYGMTRRREFWGEKGLQKEMIKYATSCVANISESHQLYVLVKFRFFNDALQALDGLDSMLHMSVNKQIVTGEGIADIRKLRESIRNILMKRLGNISKEKDS